MKISKLTVIALMAAAGLAVSCMHTVVGGTSYPGSSKGYNQEEWDAALSRLGISIHGASGRAYSDRTKKQVYLWLERRGVSSFHGEYIVSGADVFWNSEWVDDGREVTVRFYDLPDGVSSYDKNRREKLQRRILTLKFAYDDKKRYFVEVTRE